MIMNAQTSSLQRATAQAAEPLAARMSLQYEPYGFADMLMKARAIRALDGTPIQPDPARCPMGETAA